MIFILLRVLESLFFKDQWKPNEIKKKDFMSDLKNEENIDDLIRRFFPSKSSEK
jgi:hypothetical protein